MKNKTIKQNQFNPKNKTKKSYVASGGKMSFFGSSKVYETPFHKPDEGDNLHDLKVILSGFYYGYDMTYDTKKPVKSEQNGLSNDLKKKVDVAIITKIDDAYEINYLASEQEISGQIITSKIPLQDNERQFEVVNRPTVTKNHYRFNEEFSNLKTNIQHVYNGFKVEARKNIEIAIIHKEDDAYKIEFLKENPYEEGNKNDGVLNHWEFILNE